MITVIADDITGAAEIAGVCLRYGLKVAFGIDSVPTESADVIIISTDSRSNTEIEAFNTHLKLATEIFDDSDSIVFKKCDSALRGFVLTELSAMLQVSKFRNILLQPANPVTGRRIQGGIYTIDNEPIEYSGFATDPDFPADNSQVQNLLLQRSTNHENITEIHTGKITQLKEIGLSVPDCTSVADLQNCCKLLNDNTLLCGSAAFFEQILIFTKTGIPKGTQTQFNVKSNFLMICGSTHPQSQQYLEELSLSGLPVYGFPDSLLQENTRQESIALWIQELITSWEKHRKLILYVSFEKVLFPDSSKILKSRMDQIVSGILSNCEINELLIEGGATAYGILNLINWKTLNPVQELAPGVLRMQVASTPSVHLTIKPGSYLWPENLIVMGDLI
ncbi:MAG: four-carbon acid sugar kinase family protein [Paludibacter sp.]|nr:four-carbon acid sugar kinase family protein [Paludibacter sp.]